MDVEFNGVEPDNCGLPIDSVDAELNLSFELPVLMVKLEIEGNVANLEGASAFIDTLGPRQSKVSVGFAAVAREIGAAGTTLVDSLNGCSHSENIVRLRPAVTSAV